MNSIIIAMRKHERMCVHLHQIASRSVVISFHSVAVNIAAYHSRWNACQSTTILIS